MIFLKQQKLSLLFLDNAIEGKPINVYGDSSIVRDVVYVKDVVNAFYKALISKNTYGLYNITSGRTLTLEEQAKIMAKVFKQDKESKVILKLEIKNSSKSFLFSIEKAKKDFGYNPKYAVYEVMMEDYKKDLQANKYNELFKY